MVFKLSSNLKALNKIAIALVLFLEFLSLSTINLYALDNEKEQHDVVIKVTIPFTPGGGTDSWARTVIPRMGEFLPYPNQIIIENIGGGVGTRAANEYDTLSASKTNSLFVTGSSIHLSYLLGDRRVRYDLNNWRALMAYNASEVVYISPSTGIANINAFLNDDKTHLTMASIGPASSDLFVLLALDILGIDVTSIFGLRGRGAARKMFERNDTNLDFQTSAAFTEYIQPLIAASKAIPLFTLGSFDENLNYIRDPQFPDLPNLEEVYFYKFGKKPDTEGWKMWLSLYKSSRGSLKLVVVPKTIEDSKLLSYRKAISAMLADKTFRTEVNDKINVNSLSGTIAAEIIVESLVSLPQETRVWLKSWIYNKYKVQM